MQKESFQVDVEEIGTFTFHPRTMRREMRIGAEYSRLTEGVETPSYALDKMATWMSTLSVLTAEAPEGWDISAMDPLEPESYKKLLRVFRGLRDQEERFRRPKKIAGQAAGAGTGGVDSTMVPADVPAAAQ